MSAATGPTSPFIKEKEDVSVTQQTTTNTNSTAIIKNSGFPCFVCNTTSEEEVLLVAAITSQLSLQIASAINQAPLTRPAPFEQYKLHFLPAEQVELEIQIQEFLSELGHQESSSSSSPDHQISTPFSLFSSPYRTPQRGALFHSRTASSSNTEGKEKINSRQSNVITTSSPAHAAIKNSASAYNQNDASFISQQAHNTHYKLQESLPKTHILPQSEPERMQEAILTTKTLENRDTKQDKERHQQSHQDAKQDEHNHQKHKKNVVNLDPLTKGQKKSFSVADLHYLSFLQDQRVPINSNSKEKSAIFQKKAPSPITMFTQTSKQNALDHSILESRSENIFVRFMHLMARILGQAEAEAHELYLRVKSRTDDVDTLTLLLSKINNEPNTIDWEKQEDLKKLVDRAKELGVPIHNSYQWSVEEKKLLKENIIMRKENLEKITQLERTDMQRLLQEVSQCHQTRSNILKLLKELMDTFIYNLRP